MNMDPSRGGTKALAVSKQSDGSGTKPLSLAQVMFDWIRGMLLVFADFVLVYRQPITEPDQRNQGTSNNATFKENSGGTGSSKCGDKQKFVLLSSKSVAPKKQSSSSKMRKNSSRESKYVLSRENTTGVPISHLSATKSQKTCSALDVKSIKVDKISTSVQNERVPLSRKAPDPSQKTETISESKQKNIDTNGLQPFPNEKKFETRQENAGVREKPYRSIQISETKGKREKLPTSRSVENTSRPPHTNTNCSDSPKKGKINHDDVTKTALINHEVFDGQGRSSKSVEKPSSNTVEKISSKHISSKTEFKKRSDTLSKPCSPRKESLPSQNDLTFDMKNKNTIDVAQYSKVKDERSLEMREKTHRTGEISPNINKKSFEQTSREVDGSQLLARNKGDSRPQVESKCGNISDPYDNIRSPSKSSDKSCNSFEPPKHNEKNSSRESKYVLSRENTTGVPISYSSATKSQKTCSALDVKSIKVDKISTSVQNERVPLSPKAPEPSQKTETISESKQKNIDTNGLQPFPNEKKFETRQENAGVREKPYRSIQISETKGKREKLPTSRSVENTSRPPHTNTNCSDSPKKGKINHDDETKTALRNQEVFDGQGRSSKSVEKPSSNTVEKISSKHISSKTEFEKRSDTLSKPCSPRKESLPSQNDLTFDMKNKNTIDVAQYSKVKDERSLEMREKTHRTGEISPNINKKSFEQTSREVDGSQLLARNKGDSRPQVESKCGNISDPYDNIRSPSKSSDKSCNSFEPPKHNEKNSSRESKYVLSRENTTGVPISYSSATKSQKTCSALDVKSIKVNKTSTSVQNERVPLSPKAPEPSQKTETISESKQKNIDTSGLQPFPNEKKFETRQENAGAHEKPYRSIQISETEGKREKLPTSRSVENTSRPPHTKTNCSDSPKKGKINHDDVTKTALINHEVFDGQGRSSKSVEKPSSNIAEKISSKHISSKTEFEKRSDTLSKPCSPRKESLPSQNDLTFDMKNKNTIDVAQYSKVKDERSLEMREKTHRTGEISPNINKKSFEQTSREVDGSQLLARNKGDSRPQVESKCGNISDPYDNIRSPSKSSDKSCNSFEPPKHNEKNSSRESKYVLSRENTTGVPISYSSATKSQKTCSALDVKSIKVVKISTSVQNERVPLSPKSSEQTQKETKPELPSKSVRVKSPEQPPKTEVITASRYKDIKTTDLQSTLQRSDSAPGQKNAKISEQSLKSSKTSESKEKHEKPVGRLVASGREKKLQPQNFSANSLDSPRQGRSKRDSVSDTSVSGNPDVSKQQFTSRNTQEITSLNKGEKTHAITKFNQAPSTADVERRHDKISKPLTPQKLPPTSKNDLPLEPKDKNATASVLTSNGKDGKSFESLTARISESPRRRDKTSEVYSGMENEKSDKSSKLDEMPLTRKDSKRSETRHQTSKPKEVSAQSQCKSDSQQADRDGISAEVSSEERHNLDLYLPNRCEKISTQNDAGLKSYSRRDRKIVSSELPNRDDKNFTNPSSSCNAKLVEPVYKSSKTCEQIFEETVYKNSSDMEHNAFKTSTASSSGGKFQSATIGKLSEQPVSSCITGKSKPILEHVDIKASASRNNGGKGTNSLTDRAKNIEQGITSQDNTVGLLSVKKVTTHEPVPENIKASTVSQQSKDQNPDDKTDNNRETPSAHSQPQSKNLQAFRSPSKSEKDSRLKEKDKNVSVTADKSQKSNHHMSSSITTSQQEDRSETKESKSKASQSISKNGEEDQSIIEKSQMKQKVKSSDTSSQHLSEVRPQKNKIDSLHSNKMLSSPETKSKKQQDAAEETEKNAQEKKEELVALKRKDQGSHECEVMNSSFDAAAEGGIVSWNECLKNPGHTGFIPVADFSLSHLPQGHRNECIMECIQYVSKCTGRLRVCYTSKARPDGYTFAVARGTKIQHTGSAYVYQVYNGKGNCPCPDIEGHNSPRQKWWKLKLQTACHVVYNTEEARNSKVDLHFDDEKASEDGRMKTIHGMVVTDQNMAADRCDMVCMTHDEELVKELLGIIEKSRKLFSNLSSLSEKGMECNLCVMVSHPHGMHKHVTVGKMKSRIRMNGIGRRKFTYDTQTCPGCSGAPIIMPVGVTFWPVNSPWMAPHSSAAEDGGFSQSGEGNVWWL